MFGKAFRCPLWADSSVAPQHRVRKQAERKVLLQRASAPRVCCRAQTCKDQHGHPAMRTATPFAIPCLMFPPQASQHKCTKTSRNIISNAIRQSFRGVFAKRSIVIISHQRGELRQHCLTHGGLNSAVGTAAPFLVRLRGPAEPCASDA